MPSIDEIDVLRHVADDAIDRLSALEENQARNAGDLVLAGDAGFSSVFSLTNFAFSAYAVGDFLDDRTEHAARAAPRRPEVDEHGLVALQNFGLEIGLGNVR